MKYDAAAHTNYKGKKLDIKHLQSCLSFTCLSYGVTSPQALQPITTVLDIAQRKYVTWNFIEFIGCLPPQPPISTLQIRPLLHTSEQLQLCGCIAGKEQIQKN